MRNLLAALALALALIVSLPAVAFAQSDQVSLEFTGLEPLGDDAVYEGWLIVDGAPQSTGTFAIDDDGNVSTITSRTVAEASTATTFVLTIEPTVDPDPAPADTHVLAGDFTGNRADLTIDHPAALGTDFADVAGSFIVATPTTADTDDDLSGVWFLDPSGADGPVSALDLPTLPAGWAYEGWIVVDGVPLSTGRFTSADGADDFNGFSGPDGAPPFPGEDLISSAPDGLSFPADVSGATVVISVEPDPDDSPSPFALKPLIGEVPATPEVGALQSLSTGPAAPTGTATIDLTPVELAMTGVESWQVALIAAGAVVVGGGLIAASRRQAMTPVRVR